MFLNELLDQLIGVFVFTGVPGRKSPIEVDTDLIMSNLVLKNQVVFGTVNADTQAFVDAVDDLQRFQQHAPEALQQVISGRHPLPEFERLVLEDSNGIKDVIEMEV